MVKKKAKKPTGRKPKLTPKTQKLAIDALLGGASQKEAAAVAGVALSTFTNWLARGAEEKAKPLYVDFLDEVTRATALATARLREIVQMGADGHLESVERIKTTTVTTTIQGPVETVTETEKRKTVPSSADARWLLERRDPDVYADQSRHKVEHGGQVEVVQTIIENYGNATPINFDGEMEDPDDPVIEGE